MTHEDTDDGRIDLKFGSGPSTTLAIADRCDRLAATVRYDDEKGIEEGCELNVLSAHSGEKMGEASVEHAEMVPVRRALDVVSGWYAEYGIETPDQLVSALNKYYDEAITPQTEVKVIILNPDLNGEWVRPQ